MSATATAILPKKPISGKKQAARPFAKPIGWTEFQRRYLSKEDGFKYEWVDGKVLKTIRSMDKTQLYILLNLQHFFRKLLGTGQVHGELIAEPDLFFLTNHRRPDIAWLTTQQIYTLAEPDAYEVPAFVIEVVSSNDQTNNIKAKMLNYRDAGVQVVWQIFPKYKQIDVYSGPNLEQMTVCSGEKICSAAPALPHFQIAAQGVFHRPTPPEL